MIGRFPTAWITLFCAFVAIILPYSAGLHCCMNDKCEPGPRDECGNNNTITTCGWEPGSAGSFSYSCQTHYSNEKRRFPAYCQPTDEKCECTTEYCNNKYHTPTQAPAPALPPGPLSAPNPPPPATKSASANLAIPNEVLAAVVIFLCKFHFVN